MPGLIISQVFDVLLVLFESATKVVNFTQYKSNLSLLIAPLRANNAQ